MRHFTAPRILAFAALALAAAVPAPAQFRAGPEFRVNGYTTGVQSVPDVAVEPGGEFVVVWQSYLEDGSSYGVFGQAFRPNGQPRGNTFRASPGTAGFQGGPKAARDGNEIVVAWDADDGFYNGVFVRTFQKDGDATSGQQQVNTYTTGQQIVTAVAKGRRQGSRSPFVVVWSDYGHESYGDVMARRYDERGAALGDEFRVNGYATRSQLGGRVGVAEDGHFVVVWGGYGQDGSAVFGKMFSPGGTPLTPDVVLSTNTAGDQGLADVAMTPDGRFVAAWIADDGSYAGVWARRFGASMQPLGGEFQVNTYTTSDQSYPRVAINDRGDFVVTWYLTGSNDDVGVFAQRFYADGSPVGAEFRVNSYTTYLQRNQAVGVDEVGNFVVAWTSRYQDGSDYGIYAQRFGGILFPAIRVDTAPSLRPFGSAFASDGNGVMEPEETATVETFWQNVSGVAQGPIGGQVVSFSGPAGPTYIVPDPNASFGLIPNGATVGCSVTGDCYTVGVSGPRPATHWDAVMVEGVNSAIMGQAKLWGVHVGESFTDVPRTNPFYKFVETLLHRGVTNGCGAATYCPQSPTTRAQMAVFVLVTASGPVFQPVPCGRVPMFADVPPSSGFCRWVEELARRGVVSGCGGGNYCPSAAVTREQMAVFVLRALDGNLDPPACTTPMFADVPASNPFCKWIEELARRGVVTGCGGGNYCPSAAVTREQMGAFLTVTFGLTLYGP